MDQGGIYSRTTDELIYSVYPVNRGRFSCIVFTFQNSINLCEVGVPARQTVIYSSRYKIAKSLRF